MGKRILFHYVLVIFFLSGCTGGSTSSRSKPALQGAGSGIQFSVKNNVAQGSVEAYLVGRAGTTKSTGPTNGLYSISNVEAGVFSLFITAKQPDGTDIGLIVEGIDYKNLALNAGTIALLPLGSITGQVIGGADSALNVTAIGTDLTVAVATDGSFTLAAVPQGTYRIALSDAGSELKVVESVIVASGKETQIESFVLSSTETPTPSTTQTTADETIIPGVTTLTGGSVVIDDGSGKSGSRTISISFVAPTGATLVKFGDQPNITSKFVSVTKVGTFVFTSDGEKTIHAVFKDDAERQSNLVTATVLINTTHPADPSLLTSNNTLFTGLRSPNLAITSAGASEMRLALTSTALDTTNWIPFSALVTAFDLGDNLAGTHPVWHQYRSAFGVAGGKFLTDISVVKTGPTIASANFFGTITDTKEKDIVLIVTPGTVPYDVKTQAYSCDDVTYKSSPFNAAGILIDITGVGAGCIVNTGSKNIRVKIGDSLGNLSVATAISINYDTTPPATPTVNSIPSPLIPSSVTVSGAAEIGSSIAINGGLTPVQTTTSGAGIFSTTVNLNLNSTNDLLVTATDLAGNTSVAATVSVVHDSIPPVFVSAPALKITAQTVNVIWTTDENSTSETDYGTTVAYGSQKTDAGLKETHATLVDNLNENTEYHFRVTIRDAAGNQAVSGDSVARTFIDKSALLFADDTWNQTATPYYISGNFRINSGVTVTVGKGVRIALESATQILVRGKLIANGTATEPVVFTTNDPFPIEGIWDRIEFFEAASLPYAVDGIYDGGSRLSYVTIEYGGGGGSSVRVEQKSFSMHNSTVSHSAGVGVEVVDVLSGSVSLRGNKFLNNSGGALRFIDIGDEPPVIGQSVFVTDNLFVENGGNVISVTNFESVDILKNIFKRNAKGISLGSVKSIIKNNIFEQTPETIYLPVGNVALISGAHQDVSITNNAFLRANAPDNTVLRDADLLSGQRAMLLTFQNNLVADNTAALNAGSLMTLVNPLVDDPTTSVNVTFNFRYNNLVGNNTNLSNRYVMRSHSIRDTVDLDARNNYWGVTNALTVQQKFIYDYTDYSPYRAIDYVDGANPLVLTADVNVAPVIPPKIISVTSPAAGEALVTWTKSTEADVAGYFLYYSKTADSPLSGTGAVEGNSKIDSAALTCAVTATVACSVTGLDSTQTYYFSVTAYDTGASLTSPFPAASGTANDVSDQLTMLSHGLTNGVRGVFSSSGTLPVGLDSVSEYFVYVIDANTFRVSLGTASAEAVDLTTAGSGTHTFTPNSPLRTRQDYQVAGSESWYSAEVSQVIQ